MATNAPGAAPSDFVVGMDADLGCTATNDAAGCPGPNPYNWNRSTVSEPSVGVGGNSILETWNWYAGYSTNGGASFNYMDPSAPFAGGSSYGGFCCDQLAYYEPSRDIFMWVLQYCPLTSCISGENGIRIAVANGAAGLASRTWHFWDLTPSTLGASGYWLDQPKISTSSNYAYIAISAYSNSGVWHDSYLVRIPLDALKNGTPPAVNVYGTPLTDFSPAPVQGATSTMYFGSHVNSTTMHIFSWPESSAAAPPTVATVANSNYQFSPPFSCPKAGQPYATSGSATPSDWCPRGSTTGGYAHDSRINTGWVKNGVIGFAWDAGQGVCPNLAISGPCPVAAATYPYVDVLRINETTKTRIDEPIIYSPSYAIQWSSLVANANGDLAGLVQWGGNLEHQNCGAVIHDGFTAAPTPPSTFAWEFHNIASSNSDTGEPKSGDYTTTRPVGNSWAGACYVLLNGGTRGYVHPHYVTFGRAGTPPPPVTQYALSVTKSGDGSGTIASSPAGIDCGAACSASFSAGTAVTLTASNPGSTFAGWSGAGCSGTGACTVTMSASQTVNAQFNKVGTPPTILSVTVGPGRTIKLTKGGRKVASVRHGKFKIVVQDKTKKDNFHLTCPGVNKKTKVKAKGTASWSVTLAKGTCSYKSDAHKKLKGTFRVT